MSIVTKGLGGPALICRGFGWLHIIKIIVEVIKRFLPWRRKKVLLKVPVVGSPFLKIQKPILVVGNPFQSKELFLRISGSLIAQFSFKKLIRGSPFSLVREVFQIQGNLSEKVLRKLQILGTSSSKFEFKLLCKGEKDLKRMLWEVLEDEE